MRKLLLLALLLYDIVATATRPNIYDYDDLGGDVGKIRHANLDDKRREWRRKSNLKEIEHKEWEDRNRRHEYDNRYFDDLEKNFALDKGMSQDRGMGPDRGMGQDRRMGQENGIGPDRGMGQDRGQERGMSQDRPRDRENEINYRRRYDDVEKLNMALGATKSAEIGHPPQYIEKEPEKKALALSCDRQHERYEACFAGCAAVSCDNPRDRLRPCYPFCEPGCVCVPPYVRDDRTHKCVMPDDCTKGLKGIPDLGDES